MMLSGALGASGVGVIVWIGPSGGSDRGADAVGATVIDLGTLEKSVDRAAVRYDADGD